MIVPFETMEYEVKPNLRDGMGDTLMKTFKDDFNKIMIIKIDPGCSIGMHQNVGNSEIYYTLSGKGKVNNGDGTVDYVKPGDCHYCPKECSHEAICDGDEPWIFFAMVPEHNK